MSGVDAPVNYGADYEAAFEAIYPELARDHGTLIFEDFLAGLRIAFDAGVPQSDLLQADGLHPTALGIRHMVEAIGPKVEDLIALVD